MHHRYYELTSVERAFTVRTTDFGFCSILPVTIRAIAFLMRHYEFRLLSCVITNAPTSVLVAVRAPAARRDNLVRWYTGNWRD